MITMLWARKDSNYANMMVETYNYTHSFQELFMEVLHC